MPRPRQLRHKLMLGLALVLASVALLLAGTLYGITRYRGSVHTTERKLLELNYVTVVAAHLAAADQPDTPAAGEFALITTKVADTLAFLQGYRALNAETVKVGLDPDGGVQERNLCDDLEVVLREYDAAVRKHGGPGLEREPTASLRSYPDVKVASEKARRIADELRFAVLADIQVTGERSNKAIRQIVGVVSFAVVSALVLLAALLHYFRRWVFAPVRALQAGVRRVHAGDFDQPIELTSGDELEDLANELNAMTTRVAATTRDLARQVHERSRQLVRSERMVSVGFLAAGVAHEINNPLASIAFCGEALERRLQDVVAAAMGKAPAVPAADADVVAKYLTMIQQEAFRCKEITTKLLDFSRADTRRREPTDLAGLVRGVLEIARHLPNSRGKTVSFEPTAYVVAPVNAQDLKSVILNLVVNALDSTDDGGRLTITLAAKDGAAELTFADTGVGMPAEVLENIFEPFFTKNRTGKGTGLGLFISHQIIDQHAGTLQATSAGPGKGSTFTVRVPLKLQESRSQEPGDRGQSQQGEPAVLPFPGSRSAAA